MTPAAAPRAGRLYLWVIAAIAAGGLIGHFSPATGVALKPLGQQLSLLLVAMLTSKGASGVTGAGFITLAATLAVVPSVPVAGLALILGIDRFMSEARAITNLIGNGVVTLVVSRWEGGLDLARVRTELAAGPPPAGALPAAPEPAFHTPAQRTLDDAD